LESGEYTGYPGLSDADVKAWQFADSKLNEHIAISKVDPKEVVDIRIKEAELQNNLKSIDNGGSKSVHDISDNKINEAESNNSSKSKAEILADNRAKGRAFEQQEFLKFSSKYNNAVEHITIKTANGTKTRVDAIGLDADGNVVIYEFKSSDKAPLTKNQEAAFPELLKGGGTIVGKGKGIFTNGYQIPSGTEVKVIRPE
jgi:hypothetical protein